MLSYRPVSDWGLTGGGGDKDTGYLKMTLDSQFQQEIRQYLCRILKMTRLNGVVTISSTAFLRV
jgi:hypothetical protein